MRQQRIAVVGSGISGLAAAWLLNRRHEVHLIEKRDRLGGHTHTVHHGAGDKSLGLDTGFILYNELTYPHLTRVFSEPGFDHRFCRMWEFYLATCEAGFAHGKLGTLQLVLARPGRRAAVSPFECDLESVG